MPRRLVAFVTTTVSSMSLMMANFAASEGRSACPTAVAPRSGSCSPTSCQRVCSASSFGSRRTWKYPSSSVTVSTTASR
jgi:hypothetical protein